MSAHTIQQRNALRTARSRNHPRAVERDWRNPPASDTPLRVVRPRQPTTWDRLIAAMWRAHDTGMQPVWLTTGLVVLAASLGACYGIGACLFGWPL